MCYPKLGASAAQGSLTQVTKFFSLLFVNKKEVKSLTWPNDKTADIRIPDSSLSHSCQIRCTDLPHCLPGFLHQQIQNMGAAGRTYRADAEQKRTTGEDGSRPECQRPHDIDAAANAALLAVNRGSGVYNIVEDDGAVSSVKAGRELGFDPAFRVSERLAREL